MQEEMVKMKFYFPEVSDKPRNKLELVNLLIENIEKDGEMNHAGYLNKDDFKKDLLRYYDDENIFLQKISTEQKQKISNNIYDIVIKCHKKLPYSDLPIFVFVYPWFPNKENQDLFRGVTAFASYRTIHLFVDLDTYSQSSLEQTVVHEWNHLVFYQNHSNLQYNLLSHLVMEGFAEVFREEIIGGDPAPWSVALDEKMTYEQLRQIKQYLFAEDMELYREIFFGKNEFERWTGYSIGYQLVKKFREKNSGYSWQRILKLNPDVVFRAIY